MKKADAVNDAMNVFLGGISLPTPGSFGQASQLAYRHLFAAVAMVTLLLAPLCTVAETKLVSVVAVRCEQPPFDVVIGPFDTIEEARSWWIGAAYTANFLGSKLDAEPPKIVLLSGQLAAVVHSPNEFINFIVECSGQ